MTQTGKEWGAVQVETKEVGGHQTVQGLTVVSAVSLRIESGALLL